MRNQMDKNLVKLIQKMAQSATDYFPGTAPAKAPAAPTTSPVPNNFVGPTQQGPSGSTTPSKYSNPGIKKMQEALVGLAQDVTSQMKPQDMTAQGPKKQEAEGRDSFGDFFAKHYLRNDKVPSVEFSPDPTKTNMADKDPRAPSKLNWVMDTMKRLGSGKAETFVDGVWGPRTNASLVNAYALASGLLSLAKEFKLPTQSYNEELLAELKIGVHGQDDLSVTKKIAFALPITDHLNRIRKLYNEVKQGILEKPEYRASIENDKPYVQYKDQNLTPQQLDALKQTYAQGFTIPVDNKGAAAKISVDDLATKDTLDKWISQFPNAKLDPYNVLTQVSNQISKSSGRV
jgi:hypothetical protein